MSQPHGNINSFNNTNSVSNVWNNCTVADEKSEILAWLSPLEPQIRHHDIQTRRVDEVGNWLTQTEEYRNWIGEIRGGDSAGSALFCYGGPGVGKTYISSVVIDTLCKEAVEGNAAVACFYLNFADQEQSPAAILGSVLRQVVGGLDEVPEGIVKAFRDRGKAIGGQMLALAEVVEFLQDISSLRSTFICIDALDEYPSGNRPKLLDLLNQILQKSSGARIFMTGRPHILDEVEKHLGGRAATRSITPTKNDIITFLRAKLKEDTMPGAMDESLGKEIVQNISETVSEIFLLVFLSIEAILQEATIYSRREKLRAMKNGLDLGREYGATLGRIKAQAGEKARLGMAVLMWISHSKRPLQVLELCHAIAIRIGSNDLSSDGIPAISTMLSCCQGLVTMEKGGSTVRLIHFTLQEYLCTHPGLFDRAHSTMAETCLTYLNFQHIKDLSAGSLHNPRETPFLEYSSLYWGAHMRMEPSDRAKTLTLKFLDHFDSHISAKLLWESLWEKRLPPGCSWARIPDHKNFTALGCITYLGITDVADVLIRMKGFDVNERDGTGTTPLMWAARYGHEEVVSLLLRIKDVQPDQLDPNSSHTALSWAARKGHEGVVRLLLQPQFVNPGSLGRKWGKAARAVEKLFGARYVNPNRMPGYGRSALSWATQNGHEGIVKLLLGRADVNPDIVDTRGGHTPLSLAAGSGFEGIVKLLLERKDINPNIPDADYRRTPLLWAAMNDNEGVVKLLLERKDVDPNIRDIKHGRTPLSWAAKDGYEGTVKLLLGRKDINPNIRDTELGQTPLSLAAENEHEGTVKLLLGRKDVNPDIPDTTHGQTPLLWATRNGHEGIVKLLLRRGDVNPGIQNTYDGQTPLLWAVEKGYEGIVHLLLEREDVNPDIPGKWDGRTPLSWAAGNGYAGIVNLLLGRQDVNPNIPDAHYSRTPLSWACVNSRERSINPLDPGTLDFSWATTRDYLTIVKLLLGRKDVNPNIPETEHGHTPLTRAAEYGNEGIVELLMEREDVNPDIPDTTYGLTPLSWAAQNGHEGTVKLLLGRKDVNPSSSNKSGQTPLTLAVRNGHDIVVQLLQARHS